jgi:putative transposase
VVSAPARRTAVFYAIERGATQRRACALMQIARSSLRYVPALPLKDAPVVQAMQRLSAQYPRYGSRRIRIFLAREGMEMGRDRCSRLWAEHGLQVPKKRSRKRIATGRPRPLAPRIANAVWSYDFVFDACANGQQLKCLTVVDEYTRESLAIDVAGSIRSARVIDVLSRLISVRGAPRYLRSDNVLNASLKSVIPIKNTSSPGQADFPVWQLKERSAIQCSSTALGTLPDHSRHKIRSGPSHDLHRT